MIISRTPYRISFFGGGTDLPQWYNHNKGAVISSTIKHYSFLVLKNLPEIFEYKYKIRYFLREERKSVHKIKHPVVREVIKKLKVKQGIDLTHHGDLPAMSGIGSSSAFTVGLLQAMNALNGKILNKKRLAKDAIIMEQKILREYVGSQDQIATTYGGLNKIEFNKDLKFKCTPIRLPANKIKKIEDWVCLFYTGVNRNSQKIEKNKIQNIKNKKKFYKEIYSSVEKAEKILLSNNKNFMRQLGDLMNKQWELKKKLAKNVSNTKIDKTYDRAINLGAIGGKLCGSGGGGFLMLIIPPNKQKKLIKLLGLLRVKFKIDNSGSKIIYKS